MLREGVTSIEVREGVCTKYNEWIQKKLEAGVVSTHPEVHNYGRGASGKNVIGYGEGMTVYGAMCKLTPRLSSRARTVPRRTRPLQAQH
jgi:hypothetical protein